MKRIIYALLALIGFGNVSRAQLEKIIVETYYVSDSLDATDSTDMRTLTKGSKTYRVYVDMKKGYKLLGFYSNSLHPTKISSTANFYNNIDRPTEYYGYLIKKLYFPSNPLLALDSWLTIGQATTTHNGILKTLDTDGSFINPTGTGWGGSYGVPGGLLRNTDPSAGIPIRVEDGHIPNAVSYTTTSAYGFVDYMSGSDTTCFGDSIGASFTSYVAHILQTTNEGIAGPNPDSNQVLIAQLTTLGDISFEFNLQIMDSTKKITYYVANQNASALTPDTVTNPFLTYPPTCGCTDPRYFEYSSAYSCADSSKCITLKVYGCTDTMACNFDPSANVMLPNFCCYPGYCQDRDLAIVCAGIHPRLMKDGIVSAVYPNPVDNYLSLQMLSPYTDYKNVSYEIYDAVGKVVQKDDLGFIAANTYLHINAADLEPGLYLLKISADNSNAVQRFIKN